MTVDDAERDKTLTSIAETIGAKSTWVPYPGGYPNEVAAALLDSVFSLRAVYGSSPDTGVRRIVTNWRSHVGQVRTLNSLSEFVVDVDAAGGTESLKSILGSNAVAVPNSKDKPTKAAAVYGVARTLVEFGVDTADEVRKANVDQPAELFRAIVRERGIGDAGATYFLMLLGVQGIKADVMIRRFVARAIGASDISGIDAKKVMKAAAAALDVDMRQLDHAIWLKESELARASRRRR